MVYCMKRKKKEYKYLSPWTCYLERNRKFRKRRIRLRTTVRSEYLKQLQEKMDAILKPIREREREKSRSKIDFNSSNYQNINKLDCKYKQYKLIRNNTFIINKKKQKNKINNVKQIKL